MTEAVVTILKKIQQGLLDPKEISVSDRRACVAYLRLEGYTQEEIAGIFKVHRQTILRDEKAIRSEAARLVDEIDVRNIAGELIALAHHLQAKALREKDYGLAWRIERELIQDLQSLGYLPRSPERHQVQIGTFADLVELACKPVDSEVIEPQVDSPKALPGPPEQDTTDDKVDEATA